MEVAIITILFFVVIFFLILLFDAGACLSDCWAKGAVP